MKSVKESYPHNHPDLTHWMGDVGEDELREIKKRLIGLLQ